MKKALTGILILCLLLSLCACAGAGGKSAGEASTGGLTGSVTRQAKTASSPASASEALTTAAQTTALRSETTVVPTSTAPPAEEGEILDCGYFTIRIPKSWTGKYLANSTHSDSDIFSTSLHELENYNNHFGGRLVSITMYPGDMDYTDIPCSLIARIEVAGKGVYNLLSFLPTDVQYDFNNAETYLAMYHDVPAILDSIEYKDGVTVLSP